MQLQPNTLLQKGKYKIESVLGQGGFGVTYLAERKTIIKDDLGEIETQIRVTIKEFFMKDLCDRNSNSSHVSVGSSGSRELVDKFKAKFVKEAKNIATLKHQNIIKVLDVFEENGTAYYVMEYINGGSLNEHVAQCGTLAEAEALHYIRQIADALHYIHSQRINHLDIKPSNILLKEGAISVLIDFGLAKQYDNSGEQTSSTPVGISKGYAPMEQYKAGGVSSFSPATDIYSLGATLYKLVTGKTPPEAYDLFDNGLLELPNKLSQSTKEAIKSSMQLRRDERPQSIEAFLNILSGNADQTSIIDNSDVEEEEIIEDNIEIDNEIEESPSLKIYLKKGYVLCAGLSFLAAAISNFIVVFNIFNKYVDIDIDTFYYGYSHLSICVINDIILIYTIISLLLIIPFVIHLIKKRIKAERDQLLHIKIRKTLGALLIHNPYLNLFIFSILLPPMESRIVYFISIILLLGYFINIFFNVKNKIVSRYSFVAIFGIILIILHNFTDKLSYSNIYIIHAITPIGYLLITLFFVRLYLLQSKYNVTPNFKVVEK